MSVKLWQMKTIRLTIAYDGTNYHGWQIQPNGISIQQVIQERLAVITGENGAVMSAGRTDAGVHALGQIAAFHTSARHTPVVFQRALNAALPPDIRILDAVIAADAFHPRFDARDKMYAYVIANTPELSPFTVRYAWKITHSLNSDAMRKAAGFLEGKHDFSSFRASGCGARTTERTVASIKVSEHSGLDFLGFRLEGTFLIIRVTADAFLRHMVRNIVGTLVDVGLDKRKADAVPMLLRSKNRSEAGPTAPACGLFLERVSY
ncbi:MAG TPA: tRNA pseudouridine(38-40) synthase TruA [Dissulfurispiraceae bacterium]|nr:tRNA pseudouridine(38-40) synthase TruA [Dissulfurispiraceae bacterium]